MLFFRLQSIITSRIILDLRLIDDCPDWLDASSGEGLNITHNTTIFALGNIGAPLETHEELNEDEDDDESRHELIG